MKSTIRIELTEDNKPCLDFNLSPSEDIRDKLGFKFLEGLGYDSNWCRIDLVFSEQTGSTNSGKWRITPISSNDLLTEMYYICARLEKLEHLPQDNHYIDNIMRAIKDYQSKDMVKED